MMPNAILSLGEAFRSRATADEWTTVASDAAAAAAAVEIRESRREGLSGGFITKAPYEGVDRFRITRYSRVCANEGDRHIHTEIMALLLALVKPARPKVRLTWRAAGVSRLVAHKRL